MTQDNGLRVSDFVAEAENIDPTDIPADARARINDALDELRAADATPVPEPPQFNVVQFDVNGSYEGPPYEATATVADADGDLDVLAEALLRFEDPGGGLIDVVDNEPATPQQSITVDASTDAPTGEDVQAVVLKAREEGGEFTEVASVDLTEPVGSPDKFDVAEFQVEPAPAGESVDFDVTATVADNDGDDDVGYVSVEAQAADGTRNDVKFTNPESGQESVTVDVTLPGSGFNGETRKVELRALDENTPNGAPLHVLDTFDLTSPVGSADKFTVDEFTASAEGDGLVAVTGSVSDADGDDDLGEVRIDGYNADGDFVDSAITVADGGAATLSVEEDLEGGGFRGPIEEVVLSAVDKNVRGFFTGVENPPYHNLQSKEI